MHVPAWIKPACFSRSSSSLFSTSKCGAEIKEKIVSDRQWLRSCVSVLDGTRRQMQPSRIAAVPGCVFGRNRTFVCRVLTAPMRGAVPLCTAFSACSEAACTLQDSGLFHMSRVVAVRITAKTICIFGAVQCARNKP